MIERLCLTPSSYALAIADLHLSPQKPELSLLFSKFLNSPIAQQSSFLLILGDLFDFWIGDDSAHFFQADCDALRQYALQKPVYLQHGNRDFLIGSAFEKSVNIHLIADPCILTISQQRILLTHGDSSCTLDVEYQQARTQLRDPLFQQQFLSLPLDERLQTAHFLREQSSENNKNKALALQNPVSDDIAQMAMSYNAHCILHGHTHCPQQIHYGNIPASILGDWGDQGAVIGRLTPNGTLTLEPFTP